MNKYFAILFLFALIFTGCGKRDKVIVYSNVDFGFSIAYPGDYQAGELKWGKEPTGVDLSRKEGVIRVQAMGAGTDYENMPFDGYVKIAASVEIQNFEKLMSIESFTSDYGIKGYRTYWQVIRHEDTDAGPVDESSTAGPIYYFSPRKARKLGDQPVKTIMISCGPGLEKDAENIARSFRYSNSFITLFKKHQHGGFYLVEKGKQFRIELDENPTTGYNWFIADLNESYFKVRSSGYDAKPAPSQLVGSGGKAYWNIIPLKEGTATIRLLLYRPWEGKEKAVEEYKVRVVIR